MNKTFTFIDDFHNTYTKCITNIKVELKTYEDGRKFYYIDYLHKMKYPDGTENICTNLEDIKMPNPFSYFEGLKDNFDGEIIAFNSLTEKLIEYLLLDDEDLEKLSGSVTAQCYRKQLMYIIAILSD